MTSNDFGKPVLLAENCTAISIKPLIEAIKEQLWQSLLASEVNCEGFNVKLAESATGNGGKRYWLLCPLCENRCGVLYRHQQQTLIGCRKCLGIKYAKSVRKGMAEDLGISRKNF